MHSLHQRKRFLNLVSSNVCIQTEIHIENSGLHQVFFAMSQIVPWNCWSVSCKNENELWSLCSLEFIYVFDLPKVTHLKVPFLWQVNSRRYYQQHRRRNWLVADWLVSLCRWSESTCRPGRRWKRPGSTRQRQVGRVAIWMGRNNLWI
jgi:hypothetical protein